MTDDDLDRSLSDKAIVFGAVHLASTGETLVGFAATEEYLVKGKIKMHTVNVDLTPDEADAFARNLTRLAASARAGEFAK